MGLAPDYQDVAIHPEEIGEIILGCRISEEDRTEILCLLKANFPHANVTQAKKNPTLFKLDFEKVE